MIKDNWMLIKLHDNLSEYAMLNGTLFSYTWVNLPLVYTQLVTIAVYVYFYFVALFARINVILFLKSDATFYTICIMICIARSPITLIDDIEFSTVSF